MKIKELRSLGDADLKQKVAELRTELVKSYAQVAAGTVPKNPGRIRLAKRTLARIYTLETERGVTRKHE